METIRYEGVTFMREAVSEMSKDEFIKAHIDLFWKNAKEPARKKMLCRIYSLICGKEDKA